LRWKFSKKEWILPLNAGPRISVSRNMGAILYYHDGKYEGETVAFIQNFLKDGMVFLDIGAHSKMAGYYWAIKSYDRFLFHIGATVLLQPSYISRKLYRQKIL